MRGHNNASGQNRMFWQHFDAMDAILEKRPEISPVAICSSDSANVVTSSVSTTRTTDTIDELSSKVKKLSDVERRHADKMERQDKFLSLMEKLVDKL